MIAAGPDPFTVVAVVLGLLLPLVGGLVAYIFTNEIKHLRGEIKDLRGDLKETSRHLEGIMGTTGPLMWRVIMLEDWLEKHPGQPYSPPRDMGWVETRRDR